MLPFLAPKKIVSIISERKGRDSAKVAPEVEYGEGVNPELKECATEVLGAIERKSVVDLTKALHAFFEMCDEMPHKEGPHEEGA